LGERDAELGGVRAQPETPSLPHTLEFRGMTAVAADVSLRQFTSTVELSHLLGEDHIADLHSWCNEHPEAAAVDAAQWLIEQGWTTRWQGQQLVAGHHSFFLRHYKLVSRLGGGGMGTVFQAIDDRTGRLVAVKVIRKSAMQKANALERFRREVAALGKLRHPNIVAAYEAGQLGAYHYLVMEYIEGRDLGHWIAKLKRLPIDMACEIARQCALGLDHAHKLGFIHRDVKPSNLIAVRKSNGELDVRILDFGLARSFDGSTDEARVTRAGQIVGTVDYLAPEQAQGSQNVDGRADVYSLGITLFEMIAGRMPFTGDSMMARLVARVTQKAPSIVEFAPDASPALASLLEKALEFDPNARFATAGEFASGLQRVVKQSAASVASTMSTPVEMAAMEGGDDSTKVRTPDASLPAFDDFQQALEDKARRASDSQQMAVPRWLGRHKYLLAGAAGVLALLLIVAAAKVMSNSAKADASASQPTAMKSPAENSN
jgi:serine/threonine protein kinase